MCCSLTPATLNLRQHQCNASGFQMAAFRRHVSVQNYEGMLYREALKTGCYDLQKARDTYRSFVQEEGIHCDLFLQYAEVSSPHTFQSVT